MPRPSAASAEQPAVQLPTCTDPGEDLLPGIQVSAYVGPGEGRPASRLSTSVEERPASRAGGAAVGVLEDRPISRRPVPMGLDCGGAGSSPRRLSAEAAACAPPEATRPASADAPLGDAACVQQALESLRLDVEAVFDRHRDLCRDSGRAVGRSESQESRRARPPSRPSSRQGAAQQPAVGAPSGRPPSDSKLAVAPRRAAGEPGRPPADRSTLSTKQDEAAEAISKLRNARTGYLRNDNKNWVRNLVSQPNRKPDGQRSLAKGLTSALAFVPKPSTASAEEKRSFIPRLVRRPTYEFVRATLTVLDAVLVVWEMQYAAQRVTSDMQDGIPDAFAFTLFLDMSCALFITDLLLRYRAGHFDPTVSAGQGWRYFHIAVVVAQLLQAIGHHWHRDRRSSSPLRVVLAMLSTLRLARVLSLVLVTKLIRQHPFFRELRIMVHSLTGAVKALLWSGMLIFTILLIFGTVLSEGAVAFLVQNGLPEGDAIVLLRERFGSLFDAVITLFQAMSGGIDWDVVWQNLDVLGWGYKGVFLLFVCFSLLTLLNVVTAVFIESTMARSKSDRGLVVQNELMAKKDFLQTMRDIFQELDVDEDGDITEEEMRRRMQVPEIGAYFSQLGVDSDEVGKLFLLLDHDQSGHLDPEEFMFGCLKLRGAAKSLDVAMLHREVQWIHEALEIAVPLIQKTSSLRGASSFIGTDTERSQIHDVTLPSCAPPDAPSDAGIPTFSYVVQDLVGGEAEEVMAVR